MRTLIFRVAALAACAFTGSLPVAAAQNYAGDTLEAFLSLQGITGNRSDRHEMQEDAWGDADIVFSLSRERLRLVGEYNLSSNEDDLERLQLGFEFVPDTVLWVGRYQQPASAWNNRFHHGHYVQTAVVRPSIEHWEDEGGLVPQHLTGALLESRRPYGESAGVQLSLGVGYGSTLDHDGLVPLNLLHHQSGHHELSETARLAFLPQYLGASSFGLLFGHHRMPVISRGLATWLGADQVDQYVGGAYGDWVGQQWRVMAAGYYVHLAPQGSGERSEYFAAGYLQVERELRQRFTVYVRHENSARASASRYVAIYNDDLIVHGNLAGLRWDFAHHQALTLELAYADTVRGHQSTVRLQWSSAVP